jgi:hypothetical protein
MCQIITTDLSQESLRNFKAKLFLEGTILDSIFISSFGQEKEFIYPQMPSQGKLYANILEEPVLYEVTTKESFNTFVKTISSCDLKECLTHPEMILIEFVFLQETS